MLAALPAEVSRSPSSTQSTDGSTVIDAASAASRAQSPQCVTARRPSSSPVRANTKAPVHKDTMRAPRLWARRIAAIVASDGASASSHGGTMTVCARRTAESRAGPPRVSPLLQRTAVSSPQTTTS